MLYLINSYIPVPISTQVYNKVFVTNWSKSRSIIIVEYLFDKKEKKTPI